MRARGEVVQRGSACAGGEAEREGAAGSSRAPSGLASDAPRCPRRPGRGSGRGGGALGRQRPLPEGGSGGHGAAAGPRPPRAAPGRAALPQPQPQGESSTTNYKL